ncbi:MAG: phage tail protein, partial [Bacteroidota bacterium]
MEEEYPMMAYHYLVEIDGTEVRFQEVSGLDVEIEYTKYRSGDNEYFRTINVAGMQKFSGTLVCKKGIFEDDEELMEFMS